MKQTDFHRNLLCPGLIKTDFASDSLTILFHICGFLRAVRTYSGLRLLRIDQKTNQNLNELSLTEYTACTWTYCIMPTNIE